MSDFWSETEQRAIAAGWKLCPDDFDQWKHPVYKGVYWNAIDIPIEQMERPHAQARR